MILKNEKLFKILTERGLIFREIEEINKKMMDLDKERTKLGYKMDKLKDKTLKIIEKEKIELKEFEYIANVSIESGEIEVTILDQVEEFTKQLREKKAEDAKKDEKK